MRSLLSELGAYYMYFAVALVSAAVSWSYGYATGYRVARQNEIERVRERQKQRIQATFSSRNGGPRRRRYQR